MINELLIRNVRLIDGDGSLIAPRGVALCRGGQIVYAGPADGCPSLSPSFVEMDGRRFGRRLIRQYLKHCTEVPIAFRYEWLT